MQYSLVALPTAATPHTDGPSRIKGGALVLARNDTLAVARGCVLVVAAGTIKNFRKETVLRKRRKERDSSALHQIGSLILKLLNRQDIS